MGLERDGSAIQREGTRRNVKEREGKRWGMKGKMIGSLIYLESDLRQKQGRTTNNHVQSQMNPLLDGGLLRPRRSPSLLVKKTHVQHGTQDVVIDLGPVMVKDLRRANTPAPNLVIRRAVVKGILIPTSMGLGVSLKLDLPLQHLVHDLDHIRLFPLLSSKKNTYMEIGGIGTLSVEGSVIGMIVFLDDRSNPVVQGVRRQGMSTGGNREQSHSCKIAVIGGEHDKKQ